MSSTGRSDVRDPDDFYETPAWVTDAILPHLTTVPGDPSQGAKRRILLEPACGRGAIVERLWAHGVPRERVVAIEIDYGRARAFNERSGAGVNVNDFLGWAKANAELPPDPPDLPLLEVSKGPLSFDCVITNPPFRLAMAFVQASLDLVAKRSGEVAMLLRMNWLASQERRAFHLAHPSDIYVLPRRPSFAASLRCKAKCGWAVLQEIAAPRAKRCPSCEAPVIVSTSDSTEYAWFVWGPGRGNRWFLLDEPGVAA